MKRLTFGIIAAVLAVLAMGRAAAAQEVSLTGLVTDSTDAVLPGVTVTAVHVESGNTFVGVSNATGQFRIGGLRTGVFQVTSELPGFTTVVRENVELLVGQAAVLNLRMNVSSVQETVTVTSDSPLVDLTQSSLGGNVDTRQMQDLPVLGRNWMQLTMLAPGSRANSVDQTPMAGSQGVNAGYFQLNLDGQQVTSTIAGSNFGQPQFARDAIGEFELVSSRFDATQGRSSGLQVNAVTKAGTNAFQGTVSGYFRHDRFNAKDFIVDRVLDYSNQQIASTFGGPIRKDRAHFFGYYEGEREPQSFTFTSPYSGFNIPDISSVHAQRKAGFRFDNQFSSRTRLIARANGWTEDYPYDPTYTGGGVLHPSRAASIYRASAQAFASLTQTFGNRTLNDVKIGFAYIRSDQEPIVPSTEITLRGYTVGAVNFLPLKLNQRTYSIRDDFTTILGSHELKIGGEYLHPITFFSWPSFFRGSLDASGGAVPGNIQDIFPVWNDPSTWNLGALSPISVRYRQGFGESDLTHVQANVAAWFQDNWKLLPQLVLNMGLRWDLYHNALANEVSLPPFREPAGQDWLNFGPRLGFAYTLPGNRSVVRGGFGVYYAGVRDQPTHHTIFNTQAAVPAIENTDRRADFATNPFNGPVPTFEEARQVRQNNAGGSITSDTSHTPYSFQSSIGLQQQFGQTMSVQADYVWNGGRREEESHNVNLSYNPATGVNNPFSDISRRPFPNWGVVSMRFFDTYSNYHALETAVTKRFSRRWQASGTYTLSTFNDYLALPLIPGCEHPVTASGECSTPIALAPDLGGVYGPAVGDQRHRAVINGIWDLPYNFQMSGLYFFGSGQRFATTYGGDLRDSGGLSNRVRPDGTIAPRNNLVGRPIHRVDLRLLQRFPIQRRVSIDGTLEVFNVFNHANYGSYVTAESNPRYGLPVQNLNVAYQPRMLQLGFRLTF